MGHEPGIADRPQLRQQQTMLGTRPTFCNGPIQGFQRLPKTDRFSERVRPSSDGIENSQFSLPETSLDILSPKTEDGDGFWETAWRHHVEDTLGERATTTSMAVDPLAS